MTGHPPRRALPAALALVATLALAGCGLRLETPPPAEPSPDAAEQVRTRVVDEALALRAAAGAAQGGASDEVATVLADVADFSAAHADALGGVYHSGLATPTASGTPTPTPAPTASPADVLAGLRADADSALAAADQADDGGVARLLAAIGTSRDDLAARLAAALGPADATTATVDPDATAPTPAPTGLPDGLTPDAASALVLAHDQAGYGLEVVAAKLADEPRATAWSSAAAHRAAAAAWAVRAGVAGTAQDPRQPAYALPAGLDDPTVATAFAATLEAAVAQAASAALVAAHPGARGELVDELRAATAAARVWGAAPLALPGMPSDAPTPSAAPPTATAEAEFPPLWPPEASGSQLPEHLPRDTGPHAGASGEATVAEDGSIAYAVASGDTLGAIGLRFFPDDATTASVGLLEAMNPDAVKGESIRQGDQIVIPNGRYTGSG